MPFSFSFAISIVLVFNISEFFFNNSLVVSVTCFCKSKAPFCFTIPNARAIWLFHSGIVFKIDDCILSTKALFPDCKNLICGAVCIATALVSFKSCTFFSNLSIKSFISATFCASNGSFVSFAFASNSTKSFVFNSSIFLLPAIMYKSKL